MTMHAITIQQPWADAIARHGKNVENRKTRPPAALIGQRIAIHVSKTWPHDGELWGAMEEVKQHCPELAEWNYLHREMRFKRLPPPHAGRIIATARLVGYRYDNVFCLNRPDGTVADIEDYDLVVKSSSSPWFTGPVGWVLEDVRPLAVPVGQECDECGGDGCRDIDDGGNGRACCCNGSGQMAIRGQLYPFALSAEVETAILRQEGKC